MSTDQSSFFYALPTDGKVAGSGVINQLWPTAQQFTGTCCSPPSAQ